MTLTYQGGCHCGAIRLSFMTELHPEDFNPRADQSGFCTRHKSAAISDPKGRIEISLAETMTPYHFGMKITDFHLCNRCGVFVAATWKEDDALRGVVKVHALDDATSFNNAPIEVDFDGETLADRIARRRANWTPATFTSPA